MVDNINVELEQLVKELKSDPRFRILQNERAGGVGSDAVEFWIFTELESENLNIRYGQEVVMGSIMMDDIIVTDKKRDVYTYSNSTYSIDKPVEHHRNFTINELKRYIMKNA